MSTTDTAAIELADALEAAETHIVTSGSSESLDAYRDRLRKVCRVRDARDAQFFSVLSRALLWRGASAHIHALQAHNRVECICRQLRGDQVMSVRRRHDRRRSCTSRGRRQLSPLGAVTGCVRAACVTASCQGRSNFAAWTTQPQFQSTPRIA
ncbi:hypothetical protein [Candidatus Poriferisodalis sp.]|uniref:hypothetical protein n=1 Tax=Candidatus Poriferisodalis sp. TaxID=3101277 RepID=UPI003B01E30A